jgi:hypothetical protein
MRTLQELAQEAIDIQNACNPLGLTKSFAEVTQELWVALDFLKLPRDTESIRTHPIVRLWASKLHDLVGMGLSDTERYGEAYHACQSIAKGV